VIAEPATINGYKPRFLSEKSGLPAPGNVSRCDVRIANLSQTRPAAELPFAGHLCCLPGFRVHRKAQMPTMTLRAYVRLKPYAFAVPVCEGTVACRHRI